jgi:hypothetical protein
MAFKGARSDPVQGIKGSKPRLRRPKSPRRPETAESAKLGEEYLRKRNALLESQVQTGSDASRPRPRPARSKGVG